MKKALLATLSGLMTLQAGPVVAENYQVSLTRKGSNVYKIDGKDIVLQTRYCYVYAYSEEAIFEASGYGGELIFFDSKDKCDVNPPNSRTHAGNENGEWLSPVESMCSAKNAIPGGHSPWVKPYPRSSQASMVLFRSSLDPSGSAVTLGH